MTRKWPNLEFYDTVLLVTIGNCWKVFTLCPAWLTITCLLLNYRNGICWRSQVDPSLTWWIGSHCIPSIETYFPTRSMMIHETSASYVQHAPTLKYRFIEVGQFRELSVTYYSVQWDRGRMQYWYWVETELHSAVWYDVQEKPQLRLEITSIIR